MIRRPDFVFLDFDGVIMDSMGLKLDSYCHAFAGLGFAREDVRRLQLASAGLSRFKTLPLMYRELSGKPMPEDLYRACLERFTVHDEASRAKMTLKAGAGEFLAYARSGALPLAIVTGTPQEAIDRTVDLFDLRRHFQAVCGFPGGKPGHLRNLLERFRLDPARCLFVGDALVDQESAAAAGIPFAGLNNGDDPFRPGNLVAEIRSLDGLIALFA